MGLNQAWIVRCDGKDCFSQDEISGSKRIAAFEFKLSGWSRVDGLWYCPFCTKKRIELTKSYK